ncbi:Zinc finger MYM-type protein 4 [Frankliniella fusca]|uniref:Zinc finger MYM-type protein 4 n=1 Tax=Frankliniella fusca TaxID=407009 RepID=A0AAE1LQ29_9NEOP|nr:Zinc finger MYM-type protein 4 [Frankliniella fusca]
MDSAVNEVTADKSSLSDSNQDVSEKLNSDLDTSEKKGTEESSATSEKEDVLSNQGILNLDEREQEATKPTQCRSEETSVSSPSKSDTVSCDDGKSSEQTGVSQGSLVASCRVGETSLVDDNISTVPPQTEDSASLKASETSLVDNTSSATSQTEDSASLKASETSLVDNTSSATSQIEDSASLKTSETSLVDDNMSSAPSQIEDSASLKTSETSLVDDNVSSAPSQIEDSASPKTSETSLLDDNISSATSQIKDSASLKTSETSLVDDNMSSAPSQIEDSASLKTSETSLVDDNISSATSQIEDSASLKTSDSNLLGSSDNLKTDKETEPALQIVQIESLNDKCDEESVPDSETHAAVNSILEQPPCENIESQCADKETTLKNQSSETVTSNESASLEQSDGKEVPAERLLDGPSSLSEERSVILQDEDDLRVLSVDSLSERVDGRKSLLGTKDSAMAVDESVPMDSSNTTTNLDVNKSTSAPCEDGKPPTKSNTSVLKQNNQTSTAEQTSTSETEPRIIETGTKPTSTDVEEGLCIVPDTEPRVPTEQEKADAFEKANKTSGLNDDASEIVCESNKSESIESSRQLSSEQISIDKRKETDEELSSAAKPPKFGIQLVSTSSLVTQQDTEKDQTDIILRGSAQDDIQTGDSGEHTCAGCGKLTKCKYHLKLKGIHLCEDKCYTSYRKANESPHPPQPPKVMIRPRKLDRTYVHKCGQCLKKVDIKLERSLTWETMDFCSVICLEKYQKSFGSHCANCKKLVQSSSLGKYCVRFGYDMKQFCDARCLEDFKKGLKVCSYCQKDISADTEGFLAPVGDKGQFKDFCSQECMEKYDQMSHNTIAPETTHECAVCNISKPVKVEVLIDSKVQKLCSEPCFAAFKFANQIVADQCDMCKKYYDHNRTQNFTVYYDEAPHSFCCKTCMNVYILAKRKIVPCSHCKVKKYNFDMIKKTMSNGHVVLMVCSLHCLNLYGSTTTTNTLVKKSGCEFCGSSSPTLYHLSMSDASVRNFCSSSCVVTFQDKFQSLSTNDKTPYPLGAPRKIFAKKIGPLDDKDHGSNIIAAMPVISSVTSLAPSPGPVPPLSPAPASSTSASKKSKESETILKTVYKQQYIIRPPAHPKMANCAVQVKPKTASKEVSCQPDSCSTGTQTDDSLSKPHFIPVPIPIFIPTPMHMYTSPYPVPVPVALPIPVPIFIPTTRNSAKGIFKEIKRIQEKIPSDPFEAELLMMAEMVADDKKESTDTDSDGGEDKTSNVDTGNAAEASLSPETVTNNSFGNDVLQMALKMASEYEESTVEYEAQVTSHTVSKTPSKASSVEAKKGSDGDDAEETEHKPRTHLKRSLHKTPDDPQNVKPKRSRKSSASDAATTPDKSEPHVDLIIPKVEPAEKPDANMCLKFTLGANAWKNWVINKNEKLVKAGGSPKNVKLFKQDILQLTADELNYSLCHFVREVVNPSGQEYAPDTIYYLCLGIQQYLVENGRNENIFCDPNYEKFTSCLDEVVKKFPNFNTDPNLFVTRIEEEHLWESKQLGAYSPYVLLNTLVYFNTKHFNLMTVEEHMQLSFSHIMKHWKRPPNAVGPLKPGCSRNVILRFYPPQSALAANSKKKKVYEQQENEDNPLRCPVKLPESVKTRNDVFYLLPERSCVPDSPVWYSTMALRQEQLHKMLNRISLVKEIVML